MFHCDMECSNVGGVFLNNTFIITVTLGKVRCCQTETGSHMLHVMNFLGHTFFGKIGALENEFKARMISNEKVKENKTDKREHRKSPMSHVLLFSTQKYVTQKRPFTFYLEIKFSFQHISQCIYSPVIAWTQVESQRTWLSNSCASLTHLARYAGRTTPPPTSPGASSQGHTTYFQTLCQDMCFRNEGYVREKESAWAKAFT